MKRNPLALQSQTFDLLVCGGGIYGAWIAYDAALRGLSVALIEKNDWASATSQASSKLIHGGLRYLETYDFKLVKKSLAERDRLLKLAPHRVWPLRFGVPVYADSRFSRIQLKLGLSLYDRLSGGKSPGHTYDDRKSFANRFKHLSDAHLKAGFTYPDAQTDDARLVLELVSGAMQAGAVCVNYCEFVEHIEQNGRAIGAGVQDRIDHSSIKIDARQIVHAMGPWTQPVNAYWCRLSKGVHLVLPNVLENEALLLTAQSDGRVFFMIPWYGRTLLGTTDTDYQGDLEDVKAEPADIDYLLNEANRYLKIPWCQSDVISAFAGIRTLKQSDKAAPSAVSRDFELKCLPNGSHYAVGGKITSAREDAERVIDSLCAKMGHALSCQTAIKPFPWAMEANDPIWVSSQAAECERLGVDAECALWLMRRHGKNIERVLKLIELQADGVQRIAADLPFIRADLMFCAEHEMIVHLDDLLRRRMPLLILSRLSRPDIVRMIKPLAEILNWDEARFNLEIDLCLNRCH